MILLSGLSTSSQSGPPGFSPERRTTEVIILESPTTPQESRPGSSRKSPRLQAISECDDPLNAESQATISSDVRTKPLRVKPPPPTQILPGPLFTDPEGISPTRTSPIPILRALPSSRDEEGNASCGGEIPTTPSPGRQTRRSTRASTGFPSSAREPAPRWPYLRQTLNTGISNATDALFTVASDAHWERDAEALGTFWPRYAQEASQFDHRMIATWHRNLDVRLLFAGIFSAILTPFIVESYKLLSIYDPAPGYFGPGGYTIRVNAMWFGSLMISLIAALLSIHCKQWLDGYGVDLLFTGSGSPDNLPNICRMRQYRYQGLQKYYIPEVIGLLPVLLYISLLFFAVGLIDFLWHLNQGIAIYVSALCGIVVIFHLYTIVTPFFTTQSPFKTPLSTLLGNLYRGLWKGKLVIKGLLEKEEISDVDRLGEELDKKSFKWLMKNTRSEEIYEDCVRAEREYKRLRLKYIMMSR